MINKKIIFLVSLSIVVLLNFCFEKLFGSSEIEPDVVDDQCDAGKAGGSW